MELALRVPVSEEFDTLVQRSSMESSKSKRNGENPRATRAGGIGVVDSQKWMHKSGGRQKILIDEAGKYW